MNAPLFSVKAKSRGDGLRCCRLLSRRRHQPNTPQIIAENVTATVKWFNPDKGFGFATPHDGSADVFLHISALASARDSRQRPRPDRDGYGDRAPSRRERHSYGAPSYDRGSSSTGSGKIQNGSIKFFDESRGFGFITPTNGGRDVFVHATALSRAGLPAPREGQPVCFTTRPGKKGEEVAEIDFD